MTGNQGTPQQGNLTWKPDSESGSGRSSDAVTGNQVALTGIQVAVAGNQVVVTGNQVRMQRGDLTRPDSESGRSPRGLTLET